MEAGAGGFLQWPPIPGDGCTFLKLGPEPDDVVRVRVPACNPLPGNPSDTPPSCGFPQPDARCGPSPQQPTWWSTDQHDAVERPQGGRGMGLGGRASTTQPSWSPTPGPHISSPGGREATFPSQSSQAAVAPSGGRRGDAFWARGAACLGPLSRARGPRWNRRASRTEPRGPHPVRSPTARKHRNTQGAPPRAPNPGVESALPSSLQGSPFPQVCPSRRVRAFHHAAKKCRMHALIYLFLQQLQETMKLFHGAGQRALQPRCCCFQ